VKTCKQDKPLTDDEFRARMDRAMQRVADRVLPEVPRDRRKCIKCEQEKTLDEFRWRSTPNGTRLPRPICKDCENEARRANVELYQRALARKRAKAAERTAALSISGEITALIRATTSRRTTTPPPLPTREELAAWYREGCRIGGAS
jgi:hypothetical protein